MQHQRRTIALLERKLKQQAADSKTQLEEFVEKALTIICPLQEVQQAMPRSVIWNLQVNHSQRKQGIGSPYFTLGPLVDSYLMFYPSGDEDADKGQCSLYLSINRGVEVKVDLCIDGVKAATLEHKVGKRAKTGCLWGFSNFGCAPTFTFVVISLSFHVLRNNGSECPFDFHDVYL
eukprot:TRINITY_DN45158_c0_g1_i1.p1 TRINITY_DN45158_c0_g1~~TRINITY_DN45158_c0_g1_i1.p1  ORF type:complete len:176 (+),score=19.11 TRINITY_DN45158_c0_g1_i1:156-683(+)